MSIDELDRALLRLMLEQPRAGMREHARTLGVARGTVAARFLRLQERGIITGLTPHVDPRALGYPMLAFVHMDVAQGNLDDVVDALAAIPQVLCAHTVLGEGDLMCEIAARDTAELEHLIQAVVAIPGVVRTRSEMALTERIPRRVLPLVQRQHRSEQRN